jgi:hypothetical protein
MLSTFWHNLPADVFMTLIIHMRYATAIQNYYWSKQKQFYTTFYSNMTDNMSNFSYTETSMFL